MLTDHLVRTVMLIHPAVDYRPAWRIVVAVLGALVVALLAIAGWWQRHRPRPAPAGVDEIEALHTRALEELDATMHRFRAGTTDARRAARELGLTARTFVGTVGGSDADFTTARDLAHRARRDPRLEACAQVAAKVRDVGFGTEEPEDQVVACIHDDCRQVVASWT